MDHWINIQKDEKHIKREREKAKKMKKSQWWQNKLHKGVCHYCHKKFPGEMLTMDHIVPLSRGGKSTKNNVVPCCKECNNEKKYLTPAEMILKKLRDDQTENL